MWPKVMAMQQVLLAFFLVETAAGFSSFQTCNIKYRNLNGVCSNLYHSGWGKAGELLSSASLPASHASALSSRMLAEKPEREEPVTDWLAAWSAFIRSDLLDLRRTGHGLVNQATPVLDLSNLYGVSGDISSNVGLAADDLEIGEKTLLRLMESEHNRLEEELSGRNHGWGINKVKQEARQILIGVYQNIIVTELLPLLIGDYASNLNQALNYTVAEVVTAEELLTGTQAYLAMGTTDLEVMSYNPWRDVAAAMLNQRLTIPAGGITMDRLGDVSDALDTLGHVFITPWSEVRQDCGIQDDHKYVEAIFRTGKDVHQIEALLGGLAEEPELGAVLSPTLSCLFRNVLEKVIKGDSFWYSKESTNGFKRHQIEALKSTTLSALVCANLPALAAVQPAAFLVPDENLNSLLPCASLPGLDLDHWASDDYDLEDDEMDEVEFAVAVATNKLLEFRRFEYSLYEENYVAPMMSSARASGSVLKPSIKVMNKVNDSTLFEFVTYEFLRSPKLETLVKSNSNPSRRKRSPRTFDIIIKDFSPNGINNVVFNSMVKSTLKGMPHSENFYKTPQLNGQKVISSQTSAPGPSNSVSSFPSRSEDGKCMPSEDTHPCRKYSQYRSYSGYCNNVNQPQWGESNSVHRRFLPSEYEDGISKPRSMSVLGSPLPNPRTVSVEIHTHSPDPDPKYTLMLMQWGQFIDHDLTHTPAIRGHDNSILHCNSCNSPLIHPACLPISIPDGDSFYSFNRLDPKCIPFTRSLPGQQRLGPREQLNQISSYLDASMIYGSDECMAKKIRIPNSYLLNTFEHPLNGRQGKRYKPLPPRTRENMECFSPTGECFLAGDSRINEHPGLTVMHTLLVREHNRIATALAKLNPQWSGDTVFEETRRIVAAEIQHITYNEFLPRVLGRQSLKAFDLELIGSGYYHNYDATCSATSFNEFATAAFRFGHSTIRPNLTVLSESAMMGRGDEPASISLRKHFNNPDVVMEEHMVDDLMRGLVMSPMEAMDNKVTDEVANHLFEERGKPKSGMDLVSLNLQRAREHGIPGYNKYREMCKLKRATRFSDFKEEIKPDIILKMQQFYAHPDDVDLFTGLLSETKLNGALTGPTLACLIGLQFSHIRRCDRYWYETSDPVLRMTSFQLSEIKGTSLASLLCQNMDANTMIPRSSLDQMDRLTNPMVDCAKTVKHIDISAWKVVSPIHDRNSACQIDGTSILNGERYRKSPCTSCQCTAQGLKCETINLYQSGSSCLELVNDWGIKAVEQDETCRPQCRIL